MGSQLATLHSRRLLVGIGGGIAAYKAAALVSLLVQHGADVHCLMTENATRFVQPLTFRALSGHRVCTSMWSDDGEDYVRHLQLASDAELFIVAPATADLLAKFAIGLADDLMSTTMLGCSCPKLLAPAMNTRMWRNPATQINAQTLVGRGFHMVGPESGWLAERETGIGRMSEPDAIAQKAADILALSVA